MAELLDEIREAGDEIPAVLEGARVPPPRDPDAALLERDAERPVRDQLRQQIAKLENELAQTFASAFPRKGIDFAVGAVGGPRLLGIGDLERVRDALAFRLRMAREDVATRTYFEERNREGLELMLARPEEYRWVRFSNEDIGEPGCRHWHSRPRWGLLGVLLGWWRVKLSSGCPLSGGRAAPATRRLLPRFPRSLDQPMTKKRRKRRPRPVRSSQDPPPAVATKPRSRQRRATTGPPPAPWGSFPLVELVVLIALVMLIGGFAVQGAQGAVMIGVGLVLGSLAGLELSIREHLAGYRSHTLLLAAVPSVVTLGVLFYAAPDVSIAIRVAAAGIALALAAWVLTALFQRRSGGYAFRVRGR